MKDETARSSKVDEIESVMISLASPEDIRSWSSGEVTQTGTFDEADRSAVAGGLFCEAVFGPLQDWRCQCGKICGEQQRHRYCDVCDHFPSLHPRPQTSMGHIELASPVVHPWFYATPSSPLSVLLDMDHETLRKLVQYDAHLVTGVGQTSLKYHEILTDHRTLQAYEDFGYGQPRTLTGAEAVRQLVEAMDLVELTKDLRQKMADTVSISDQADLRNRLSLVESLRDSGNNPSWMVLDALPVVPPVLRPVQFGKTGITAHGLNALYGQVIGCNFRLRKSEELEVPERFFIDCKRRLQLAVDELFGELRPSTTDDLPGAIQASLERQLQRDIRTSFPLGKAVDFSARSVVVPNPQLGLEQCGLPKSLALTLYEPLVIRYLLDHKHAGTTYLARVLISRNADIVWDAMTSIMREHWALLSRPPILRRQRIQAFQPQLVEGNAIHIHPLLGQQFGVEFNGEPLAVYLPLSIEAQTEAKGLLSSANNLFDTQAGQLAIIPEKDVVLGCHYLTIAKRGCRGEGMIFSSPEEAVTAWEHGRIDLQAEVRVRLPSGKRSQTRESGWVAKPASDAKRIINTTIGRVLFNDVLPKEMDFYDHELDARTLSLVIGDCFRKVGRERTMKVLESIARLAQQHLSSSGLSLGIQDLLIPQSKATHLEQAEKVRIRQKKFLDRGLVTPNESYNQLLDAWTNARGQITCDLMNELDSPKASSLLSLMARSIPRVYNNNLRQLCGIIGLMADRHGWIRPLPIKANFREGLPITEYWSHLLGARQGLLNDHARSLNRDYWSRLSRLLQDIVITMEDCGTQHGVMIEPVYDGYALRQPLSLQAMGRVACETIVCLVTDENVVAANQLITHEIVAKLERMGLNSMQIRSPMTCEAPSGICQRCYGMEHSTRDLVEIGTAIGVHSVFAVSDALEHKNLLLRTFKWGIGVHVPMAYETFEEARQSLQRGSLVGEEFEVRAKGDGIVDLTEVDVAGVTVLSESRFLQVLDPQGRVIERYPLPRGARLSVEHGDSVKTHQSMFHFESFVDKVISRASGIGKLVFDGDDCAVSRKNEEELVIHQDDLPRHPRIVVSDESGAALELHYLGVGYQVSNLLVDPIVPARVSPGSVLAKAIPRNFVSQGLNFREKRRKLVGLLEVRSTPNRMTLARVDAKVIKVERQLNGSHQILLCTTNDKILHEQVRLNPRVRPGDEVRAGDPLTDGTPSLFDVLEIRGLSYTMIYLKRQIQEMLLRDRIDVADQHIELVISRMFSRAKIIDSGDSHLVIGTVIERSMLRGVNNELWQLRRVTHCGDSSLQVGELVSATELEQVNQNIGQNGGRPAESTPARPAVGKVMLQGITIAGVGRGSFLTEASYRDLRAVLANAALAGQSDDLGSLNSNVMLGRLIPVGTGQRSLRDAPLQTRPKLSPP